MPYILRKNKNRNCYSVINKVTGRVHSTCTTFSKAMSQIRLLHAVDNGWNPKSRQRRSKSHPRRRSIKHKRKSRK